MSKFKKGQRLSIAEIRIFEAEKAKQLKAKEEAEKAKDNKK